MSKYMMFNCPECGAPLEIYSIFTEQQTTNYIHKYITRHCSNCHSDWENEWDMQFGDVCESELRRKFWG